MCSKSVSVWIVGVDSSVLNVDVDVCRVSSREEDRVDVNVRDKRRDRSSWDSS